MTKDVIITIAGFQSSLAVDAQADDSDEIEVIMPANYFFRNDKHYILYDEAVEGIQEGIKNKIKISGNNHVEMMKSGATNTQMIFEKDKKTFTRYETPFGYMLVSVYTRELDISMKENEIDIFIKYELDIDHEPYADCIIKMNVRSKEEADLKL